MRNDFQSIAEVTLSDKDKSYLWHPFTVMSAWCSDDYEPLVIHKGEGVHVFDDLGNQFIDGNSSIWTNLHGHNEKRINSAINEQLKKVSHVSFLGTTNEPAILLAEKLVNLFPQNSLNRVFYTDDGSTSIECAMKMAIQYYQIINQPLRNKFIAFDNAYHGDTFGAASIGGINKFFSRFNHLGLPTLKLSSSKDLESLDANEIAAVVIEPKVQGAAGIRLWPDGMLKKIRRWCDENEVLLILDEVMTGFGRTGKMFACEHENVLPDLLCLAKGLSGGYLPLAATMVKESIFEAFLGGEETTFYYGHSYSGNPLGCAAALASLNIFEEDKVLKKLKSKIECLKTGLSELKYKNPLISEVRQIGLISGIEISSELGIIGSDICHLARNYGLLTRSIGNVIVFMPPLIIHENQIYESLNAIESAIIEYQGN
ncbi:MAG: adenosylmethionine--8-amino-7-oxononanoate transaminase [Verrucomicrobiota bacterium]|nr:adenosylmethionine--8-amino-7-oxononanoate transaminase [Verrucomicrobiota bacterium]